MRRPAAMSPTAPDPAERPAAEPAGAHHLHVDPLEQAGEARAALVGDQRHGVAARDQGLRPAHGAGTICPPVPPAASTKFRDDPHALVRTVRIGRALQIRVAPREGEQKPHADRQRDHRGAAIADERQRHALGGRDADVHRHVDRRLRAELHGQARARVAGGNYPPDRAASPTRARRWRDR